MKEYQSLEINMETQGETKTPTVECSLCGRPAQVKYVSPSNPVYATHDRHPLLRWVCDMSGKSARITNGQ